MATFEYVNSYTEALHTVYAAVSGADLVKVEVRRFRPERIVVVFSWRTQLSDKDWQVSSVVLSGPWIAADGITPTGGGSGNIQLFLDKAPDWVRDFVDANPPNMALLPR